MALFGNLVVRLGLDKARFDRGIGAARATLGTLATGIAGATAAVAAFGTALATAAVAGVTVLVKKSFEQIDVMAKMADRLGIGTETLGGLGHAANLAGVEIETLGTALQFMLKNIGKGAAGEKTFAKAFKDLGLDARTLAGMSTTNQFLAIAEAFEKIKNPAERMRLAMEVFGRGGAPILNVIGEGTAGLREMVAEAERLGLTFSRVDAAKVELANDSIERMKGALTGIANEIAISVAPAITSLAQVLTSAFSNARGEMSGLRSAFKSLAIQIFDAQMAFETLKFGGALMSSGLPEWAKDVARSGFFARLGEMRREFLDKLETPAPGRPEQNEFPLPGPAGIGAGVAGLMRKGIIERAMAIAGGAGGVLGGMVKGIKRGEVGVPTGALRNSQEALNRIVKARSGVEQQALAEEKKQTAKLDKIEKNTANLGKGLGGLVVGAFN